MDYVRQYSKSTYAKLASCLALASACCEPNQSFFLDMGSGFRVWKEGAAAGRGSLPLTNRKQCARKQCGSNAEDKLKV
jgi:hypothetical protein